MGIADDMRDPDAKLQALGLPVTRETIEWARGVSLADLPPVLEPQGGQTLVVDGGPDDDGEDGGPIRYQWSAMLNDRTLTLTERRDLSIVQRSESKHGLAGSDLAQKRRRLARAFDTAA